MKNRVINREKTGKKISEAIKKKGLNEQMVAQKMHISFQAVYGYTSGKKLPSANSFCLLAKILECPVDALIATNTTESTPYT